jgi:small subunit ribosomal protein S18
MLVRSVRAVSPVARGFATTVRLCQLPSSGEMKSQEEWIKSTDGSSSSKSAIFKVVQSARNLQDNSRKDPPLNISSRYTRRFNPGQTYDPFDFSMDKLAMEQRERRNATRKDLRDPFEASGINPVDLYTMPEILSKFLTATGQILPRDVTGCSASNQKKLGIAVKRARSCGVLSTVHKHARYLPARNL